MVALPTMRIARSKPRLSRFLLGTDCQCIQPPPFSVSFLEHVTGPLYARTITRLYRFAGYVPQVWAQNAISSHGRTVETFCVHRRRTSSHFGSNVRRMRSISIRYNASILLANSQRLQQPHPRAAEVLSALLADASRLLNGRVACARWVTRLAVLEQYHLYAWNACVKPFRTQQRLCRPHSEQNSRT